MKYYNIRGGGWCYNAFRCQTAFRNYFTPDFHFYFIGFRLTKKLKQ